MDTGSARPPAGAVPTGVRLSTAPVSALPPRPPPVPPTAPGLVSGRRPHSRGGLPPPRSARPPRPVWGPPVGWPCPLSSPPACWSPSGLCTGRTRCAQGSLLHRSTRLSEGLVLRAVLPWVTGGVEVGSGPCAEDRGSGVLTAARLDRARRLTNYPDHGQGIGLPDLSLSLAGSPLPPPVRPRQGGWHPGGKGPCRGPSEGHRQGRCPRKLESNGLPGTRLAGQPPPPSTVAPACPGRPHSRPPLKWSSGLPHVLLETGRAAAKPG